MKALGIALFGLVLYVVICGVGESAAGGTLTLTIDFGGECNPLTITGDPQAGAVVKNITTDGATFTCGHYKIMPQSSNQGEARLRAAADAGSDVLSLLNTKITKVAGSWPDLHITISGINKYQPLPDPIPAGTDVTYKVSAEGFFKRGITNQLATGSYLKTRGYQDNPTQTPPMFWLGSNPPDTATGTELVWEVCGNTGCNNYLPAYYMASTTWVKGRDTLDSTRDLQSEFWVKLYNNSDTLNLYNLTVQNTLAGGGGRKPNPKEDPPECPEVTCVPSINQ